MTKFLNLFRINIDKQQAIGPVLINMDHIISIRPWWKDETCTFISTDQPGMDDTWFVVVETLAEITLALGPAGNYIIEVSAEEPA